MKKTKLFLPVMACLIFGMGLAACQNNNASSGGNQQSSQAQQSSSQSQQQRIKITAAGDKKTLVIGEKVQLTADVGEVEWKSSDANIATVSNSGEVTAVAGGEVTITAKKEGYKDGSITITVTRPAATATFDLTTAADHYSADGWWELPSSGGMGFAMQTVTGWNPIAQESSWGQSTDEPAETFIGGFGQGDKETVQFTSSKAGKGEILVKIGNTDEAVLAEIMTVKLNGAAISLAGKTLEAHEGQYFASLEFADVSLGQLDLAASNKLEFEFLKDTNIFLDEVSVYQEGATVAVTAPAAKQQIAVANEKLEVIVGETVAIQSQTTGLSYVSVDETVATVNASGVVTGVKQGITKVTVKKDGMYSVRVEITVKPAPVAGQILVEAEDAEELKGEEAPSGIMVQKDGSGWGGSEVHSGSAYVMIYSQESEIVLTYKFNATNAATMALSVVGSAPMSMGGEASAYVLKDSMGIKLNNNTVTPPDAAEFPAPEGWSSTMSEVAIGDVAVKAGENTLVITLTGTYPSLDVFKLSAK